MKIFLSGVVLLFATAFVGCSPDNKKEATSTPTPVGTWITPCRENDTSDSVIEQLIVSKDKIERRYQYFIGGGCLKKDQPEEDRFEMANKIEKKSSLQWVGAKSIDNKEVIVTLDLVSDNTLTMVLSADGEVQPKTIYLREK